MAETTWGIRFNEYSTYQRVRKGQKPEGCPEWLESHQIHTWQKQGLVIWNNMDRKIEALPGAESLRLLGELKSLDAWKSDGVSITRLVYRVELPQTHQRKRKKGEPEPEAWNIEVPHKNAHPNGCPGFYSLAPQEQRAWIDNITVTPNVDQKTARN